MRRDEDRLRPWGKEGTEQTVAGRGASSTPSLLAHTDECAALADAALEHGRYAVAEIGGVRIVGVVDTLLAESMANGLTDPGAPILERHDGRTVHFFRAPTSWGGGRR